MPMDKIKRIEQFPSNFQFPLKQLNGKYLLYLGSYAECKSMARKYRNFLQSIAFHNYPINQFREGKDIKTRIIRQLPPDSPFEYYLYVIVKDKLQIPTE